MYHCSVGDEFRAELLRVYMRLIRRYGFDAIIKAMESEAFNERVHGIARRRQGFLDK